MVIVTTISKLCLITLLLMGLGLGLDRKGTVKTFLSTRPKLGCVISVLCLVDYFSAYFRLN